MIYTLLRLGADGIYAITRLSYDGIYYMLYGHRDTPIDLVNKEMYILKNKMESESLDIREIKALLRKLAESSNISTSEQIEEEEDLVFID